MQVNKLTPMGPNQLINWKASHIWPWAHCHPYMAYTNSTTPLRAGLRGGWDNKLFILIYIFLVCLLVFLIKNNYIVIFNENMIYLFLKAEWIEIIGWQPLC